MHDDDADSERERERERERRERERERERETSGAVHSEVSLTLEIFGDTRTTNTRHR